MAVSLKRLCELCPDLELLAGANGVPNTPVRWMHTVETEEVASFLRGQELVFITGSGIGGPDQLAPLVESIYDEFASAVVVNTGPYISRVPEDVVTFCDAHDLPLFQIPWSVHIPDIMYTISREIIDHDRWASQVAISLSSIIQYPDQAELHVHTLRQEGITHRGPYCVAVFHLEGILPGSARDDQMRAVRRMVENELAAHEWKAIPLEISGRYALVFPQEGKNAVREMLEQIVTSINTLLFNNATICCALGSRVEQLAHLSKSFRQALDISLLQSAHSAAVPVADYETMGAFRLLLGLDDMGVLADYHATTLKPLEEHDRREGTEFTELLQLYLARGGSIKAVAEELYVHRNTVGYRIGHIERILGRDLSDFASREELSLAFHVRDILRAHADPALLEP